MSSHSAVGRGVLAVAAVALLAIAVVALPAAAQNQEVTPTAAATGTNPPAKPHNLRVSPSHDAVTLTWTASTDPTVTHYAIIRRNRNTDALGVFAVIEPNAGAGTSYTDSSVSPSSSYVYRAKAVSPTGVSKWSGYARADTPPAPEPPPPPPTTTTTTTQPPAIDTATIEKSAPEPPPPDPDRSSIGDNTQGDLPPVPRAQVVIQTDQDANTIVPLDWALKPSDLSGGDQFRLLFTTHTGSRAPNSTDIDDYNTYVQSQANAGSAHSAIKPYASGFRVVGSTADRRRHRQHLHHLDQHQHGRPHLLAERQQGRRRLQGLLRRLLEYDEANPTQSRKWCTSEWPTGGRGGEVYTGSADNGTAKSSTALGDGYVEIGRLNHSGSPLTCRGVIRITFPRCPTTPSRRCSPSPTTIRWG